jgi:antitoxin VapB
VALNIKNSMVEDLAAELADLTGQSKTETIRQALERRRAELIRQGRPHSRQIAARRFFENEVWPLIPADQVGRRLTQAEEDDILGYGPEGV